MKYTSFKIGLWSWKMYSFMNYKQVHLEWNGVFKKVFRLVYQILYKIQKGYRWKCCSKYEMHILMQSTNTHFLRKKKEATQYRSNINEDMDEALIDLQRNSTSMNLITA